MQKGNGPILIRRSKVRLYTDTLGKTVVRLRAAAGIYTDPGDPGPKCRPPMQTLWEINEGLSEEVTAQVDRLRLECAASNDAAEDYAAEMRAAQQSLREERAAHARTKEALHAANAELQMARDLRQAALESARAAHSAMLERSEAFAQSCIAFRDRLDIFAQTAEDNGDAQMAKLLDTLSRNMVQILAENGVEVLRQTDAFTTDDQVVSGTAKTNDPQLHGAIKQSFRDGYRINGKTIRPQQVVLYEYSAPEAAGPPQ